MTNEIPVEQLPATEDEWRVRLSPAEFRVLRQAGTDPAWAGEYVYTRTSGTHNCRAVGTRPLSTRTQLVQALPRPQGPGEHEQRPHHDQHPAHGVPPPSGPATPPTSASIVGRPLPHGNGRNGDAARPGRPCADPVATAR